MMVAFIERELTGKEKGTQKVGNIIYLGLGGDYRHIHMQTFPMLGWGCSRVVEHLHSMCKPLSSFSTDSPKNLVKRLYIHEMFANYTSDKIMGGPEMWLGDRALACV